MTLIGYVFSKLWTAKDDAREIYKKLRFRTPFNSQYAKGSQIMLISS